MKLYLDAANEMIITVIGDQGLAIADELVRLGVSTGQHGAVIKGMFKHPDVIPLSEVPMNTDNEGSNHFVYNGLTLNEVISKCEELEL